MKYYHITPIANKERIKEEGLKSNSGQIFFFTKLKLADSIAYNQIGIDTYSLFEVNPSGFEKKLVIDNVAEYTAAHQRIALQSLISPIYVKHLCDKLNTFFDLAEEENLRIEYILNGKNIVLAKQSVELSVRKNLNWLKHYNQKYRLNLLPL
jgi:hypothetical protein